MRSKCWGNRARYAGDADWTSDHAAQCLRCQAEASRYRTLARHLAGMEAELLAAPAGLERSVMSSLQTDADAPKNTVVWDTAMAAAGAVAIAGALALLRHRAS